MMAETLCEHGFPTSGPEALACVKCNAAATQRTRVLDNRDEEVEPTTSVEVVPHPRTGELVPLDSPTDVLAEARMSVVEQREHLNRIGNAIDRELAKRLDHENMRKWRVPRGDGSTLEMEVNAPTTTEWDAALLRSELLRLTQGDDAPLTEAAVDAAVEVITSYKVKAREASKLATHADERVREATLRCRSVHPQARRVSVKPA